MWATERDSLLEGAQAKVPQDQMLGWQTMPNLIKLKALI